MADLVLSPSSVDAFRQCGWRWYLEYVETVEQETSVPAIIGLAVHAGVAAHYTGVKGEETDDPYDTYDDIAVFALADVVEPEEDPAKALSSGRRTLAAYIEDVAPSVVPGLVEQEISLTVNGIEVTMHPDVFDMAAGMPRDLKVKHAKPRDPVVYAFQMNLQALGWRHVIGSKERDVGIDVMIRLKRDRPYLVPIRNGGPVTDKAMRISLNQLDWVANEIDRGNFKPTGLENGSCRWCPVRRRCAYYEESQGAQ